MQRRNTVCFIGHRDCYGLKYDVLCAAVRNLIENGALYFLNGGMGQFDRLCARAVYELKGEYPQIRNYLVIPYLNFNIFTNAYFDEIIFPEDLETLFHKAAIPARNRYMVNHSAFALCWLKYPRGGAAQTWRYAQKKRLQIIML